MERKLLLFIAASLDGYIAGPGEDLSFLSAVEQPGEDYGYGDFIGTVDTVIIGRKTYDWVMRQVPEFPHRDKLTYVITRQQRPPEGSVHFYTGSLTTLVQQLKAMPGKHIFCDGGAAVINRLLQENLVDEIILSVIPVLLGGGTPLFGEGLTSRSLTLARCTSFEKGLVQLHYLVHPPQATNPNG